ncbi:MAG: class IV adenylate cyclase [Candidatus Altiarchaeota archaeon]|nr:class IV adenylate cyclase [Candidatus Altiarchaeota archaeon]
MNLEIELKAPCKNSRAKIEKIGAKYLKKEIQEDVYFMHPCRDFKQTDEAFRIRKSDKLYLTYKGPKHPGDLKTREELEFEVTEKIFPLLERLGFKKAFTIKKERHIYELDGLTICCDQVEGIGEYVEIESKNQENADKIHDIASKLGVLANSTTKSYSELLGF